MGGRTRIIVAMMLALAVLGAVGLTACTREKPAPTPNQEWVPPTATVVSAPVATSTSEPAAPATVISVDETVSAPEAEVGVEPTAAQVPEASDTPVVSTPSVEEVVPTPAVEDVVPTPVQPTSAPEGGTFGYVVRSGETLFSIAQRFDTSVEELARLNGLASADDIEAGQKLQIPGSSPPAVTPTASEPLLHTVQVGDTLHSIAQRYGVTQDAIMSANGISNANRIYVGQRLQIPGGEAPAETEPRTHVVQVGETLSQIAELYGVTTSALQAANAIGDPDSIYVGQRLSIP
jgi:LysM repeat protein